MVKPWLKWGHLHFGVFLKIHSRGIYANYKNATTFALGLGLKVHLATLQEYPMDDPNAQTSPRLGVTILRMCSRTWASQIAQFHDCERKPFSELYDGKNPELCILWETVDAQKPDHLLRILVANQDLTGQQSSWLDALRAKRLLGAVHPTANTRLNSTLTEHHDDNK